ncbi:MAG: type II toxin-antitoxin system RelE/ParE family toxin [Thermodesulfobacteriota bacterium]
MHYQVFLAQAAAQLIPGLPPDVKRLIRTALEEIRQNPDIGKNLQEELAGFLSYRARRYRIVYRVDRQAKSVVVYYAAHRREVYERFSELLRQMEGKRPPL